MPLIEQTIGDFFDDMAARQGEREALVSAHESKRCSYRELQRESNASPARCSALGPRARRPRRHLVAQQRGVGADAVRHRQGRPRSWSTSTRPTAPPSSNTRSTRWAARRWSRCRSFKTSDYLGMLRELRRSRRGACRSLRAHRAGSTRPAHGDEAPGVQRFSALLGERRSPAIARVAEIGQHAAVRRPDQHPVHQRHHRLSQGRDAHPPQHPQQRLLHRRGMKLTPDDRLCIPVPLYHCFGMVLGNLACLTHGATMVYPERRLRSARRAADRAGRALHRPARRADHVHRRARPSATSRRSTFSSLRTGIMAGSPCPIEVMRRVVDEMHMREITIAYGMTETSPVSFQSSTDDAARAARVDRRPRAAAPRGQDRRPRDGRDRAARRPGELCTRGYSVMLGYWDDEAKTPRPSTPTAGCTPATSPRWTPRATSTSSAASRTW